MKEKQEFLSGGGYIFELLKIENNFSSLKKSSFLKSMI